MKPLRSSSIHSTPLATATMGSRSASGIGTVWNSVFNGGQYDTDACSTILRSNPPISHRFLKMSRPNAERVADWQSSTLNHLNRS